MRVLTQSRSYLMKTAESDNLQVNSNIYGFLESFIKNETIRKFEDETDAEFLARFRKHHPAITEGRTYG
jgi:hypothetical protein